MEKRWGIVFSDEQKTDLLHLDFVNDGREELAELEKTEGKEVQPINNKETIISQVGQTTGGVEKRVGGNRTNTNEMAQYAYKISKKVFEGSLTRAEGRDEIINQVDMNPGTAGDYISAFLAMMSGDKYSRTLNEYSTRYFLDQIKKDYGETALKKAITSCRRHAEYYEALGYGRLAYVEKIVEEQSE